MKLLRAAAFGLIALALAAALPAGAAAHPLGNFTINHYAGIRVATDRLFLDVVIDRAEIPAFQERQRIDTDGDGQVSDEEAEAERQAACGRLAGELSLTEGGARLPLVVQAAGLAFPAGAAGLQTLRLTCEYEARSVAATAAGTSFAFDDRADAGRLGWREIVVIGDGTTINGAVRGATVSDRLKTYPADLLGLPLADRTVAFRAVPGGASQPASCIPEAQPLVANASNAGFGCGSPPARPAGAPAREPALTNARAAVPGGVGAEISDLLETRDLTPFVLVLSILAAIALGGFHALTPGHGKTLLAAYLVGTRGTPRHALALGLSVTVSHTIGVALLALLIVAAGNVIPADVYQHLVAVFSGLTIVAIGSLLLVGRVRSWRGRRAAALTMVAVGDEPHAEQAEHEHEQEHEHQHEHEHGGRRHSHLPAPGRELSWRTLFALGLSGGIVPSTSALIILLATVTSGRAAYGLVLVVAFGLGMAAVLSAVGLALVYARTVIDRLLPRPAVRRVAGAVPVITAGVVFGMGIVLTGSALLGRSITG